VNDSLFSYPGITSILPESWGTQKEWITLLDWSLKMTFWSTGMRTSLAVTSGWESSGPIPG
jgi:hypothetical protein